MVKFLKIGITENKTIVGIPQYECLRDCLNGVPQPQIGRDRFLDKVFLFCDVNSVADEVEARFARLANQLAARAQPYPVTGSVAHPERMVDCRRGCIREFRRELVEANVVRMHQCIDIAKREQIILSVETEYLEHRLRPEDSSPSEIPIPEPAAASIECSIDPTAHSFIDQICFTSTGCLPVEGETKNKYDKSSGG